MPNFHNDIGSLEAIPNTYKYLHPTESIDFVLKADGNFHSISLNIKVDYYSNMIYYNLDMVDIYPNRKGLYDKYHIEVEECYMYNDLKTLHIKGKYCVTEKFIKDNSFGGDRCTYDGFNPAIFRMRMYNNDLTHIAVAAPKYRGNNIIVHKELPEAYMPIEYNDTILFYAAQDTWISKDSISPIRTGLIIRIPDRYVLQISSYEDYHKTGLLVLDAPSFIHSKYDKEYIPYIKWIGDYTHIESNNYKVDQDDLKYIKKILIPAGTIIAQGIITKIESASIYEC